MINAKIIEDYFTSLKSDKNEIFSDIEKSHGGNEKGLNPHELVEAALAACTIMTMKSYANIKGFDLGDTFVDVKIENEGVESKLTRTIKLDSKIDEKMQERLMLVANKCPIHKLLMSNITIDTIKS
ncbi:OsmC-like protein [Bacteriovorax sp. BSW11_IV]|uniref:OsmC family protein n=1 Tax=Bacteriovorax sp. BSW11_IV TaxID=1353529 RepID=UPI00038A35AB|nr:OsmC family protein [Bacteriovorax sp. BSW11_IV]EQC48715.1 OsmC-like protein [Bacteriovorax sp. BSW11_IV]